GTEATADNQARVCGELTLRGVTRPLCLDVRLNALKRHPLPPFRRTAGFSATATLDRTGYGIDAWPTVVGHTVEMRIEVEATLDRSAAREDTP
ncbi:YceI family protein, partial [Cutibacterium acnes]